MFGLRKRSQAYGGNIVFAYSSEEEEKENNDTLRVTSSNECVSCHSPHNTHQRFSGDVQVSVGPDISVGGSISKSLLDTTNSKATIGAGASAYVGINVSLSEDSRAGTPEMPTIVIDSTSVDTTQAGN